MSRKSAPVRFGSIKPRMPLAYPGQRIGLLGGSFNPPHAAHRLITAIARRKLGLDAVWWIVTPGNPLKSHTELLPLDERQRMCRELAPSPKIKITTFEKDLSSTFTAATLAYIKRRHPNVHLVWLMGADNLATFDCWQDWQSIAEEMPLAIVDRPGWHLKSLASRAAQKLRRSYVPEQKALLLPTMQTPAWTFLTGPLSPLSSTEIRARKFPFVTETPKPR